MSQEKTAAGTVIQGDGMADRRVSSDDANGSLSDREFSAGLMNNSELIELVGGGLYGSA